MRALVSAASRHGSTAGIAEAIARTMRERGVDVTVREPDEVHSVSGYDVVVIGSAVYAGHWLPAAKALVDRHASALRWRDVWLFSSGPLGDPPRFEDEPADVVAILAASGARGHALLSGRLEPQELGRAERLVVRVVRAPAGDFRDWPGIEAWTAAIIDAATDRHGSQVADSTSRDEIGPLVPVPGSQGAPR